MQIPSQVFEAKKHFSRLGRLGSKGWRQFDLWKSEVYQCFHISLGIIFEVVRSQLGVPKVRHQMCVSNKHLNLIFLNFILKTNPLFYVDCRSIDTYTTDSKKNRKHNLCSFLQSRSPFNA
jgi:hypothetical protein